MFTRAFGLRENEKAGTACMLPNQARYQLRYIPKLRINWKEIKQEQSAMRDSMFFAFDLNIITEKS
jgi:hypothetical protein